jgi:hypothetical protein
MKIAFRPDGHVFAVSSASGSIEIFEVENCTQIGTINGTHHLEDLIDLNTPVKEVCLI